MANQTPYHGLDKYEKYEQDWSHGDTVDTVDEEVPRSGPLSDRPADPPVGRRWWATDVRILFEYDPNHSYAGVSGWRVIGGVGVQGNPVPGTSYFENAQVTGNLDVTGDITEDGENIATSLSTKTLDILDYGDATDADTALEDALTDANPYDTLLFRDEEFVFTASHSFSIPVNLKFVGADVRDDRGTVTAGDTLFDYVGPGIQASTTLSTDAGIGASTITVQDAGLFSAGDIVYIRDESIAADEPKTQFASVESADGAGNITLSGVVRRDLVTGANVHRVELWDNIRVEGAEVLTTAPEGEIFAFQWCHRPRAVDIKTEEIGRHVVQFAECWDALAENCEARNAHMRGSGQGEPFTCFRATDTTFKNCRTQGTRRGIDVTLGSTGVTIIEPHIEDFTKGGVSAHNGDAVRDITVIGGEISSTDPNDNACISLGGLAEDVSVYGTKMVAHREALLIGGPTDVQGIQVELAAAPSADPNLIRVVGDDVNIQGNVRIRQYEDYTAVAVVEGVSNVDLDLDVQIDAYNAAGNENPLISASSGSSHLTVRGTIDGPVGYEDPAIRLYGQSAFVENVAIEATITGLGAAGVQLRGDTGVRGVRVSDSHIDVAGSCVRFYEYDTGTTIENVWVRDSSLYPGTGNGLNVGGMAADTIYYLDNVGTGALANAGSATNVHSERTEADKDEIITGAWQFDQTINADISGDADTVDGYHGGDLAARAENENITGEWTHRADSLYGEGTILRGFVSDFAGTIEEDTLNAVTNSLVYTPTLGDVSVVSGPAPDSNRNDWSDVFDNAVDWARVQWSGIDNNPVEIEITPPVGGNFYLRTLYIGMAGGGRMPDYVKVECYDPDTGAWTTMLERTDNESKTIATTTAAEGHGAQLQANTIRITIDNRSVNAGGPMSLTEIAATDESTQYGQAFVDRKGDSIYGSIDMNGYPILNPGNVDGVDIAAHAGSASAHHSRYSDEEAQDAIGTILSGDFNYDDATPAIDMSPHTGDAAAHHSRYADSEAVTAVDGQVDNAATSVAALDDTVAGHHSDTANPHSVTAAQAGALPTAGGQMSGKIEFGGGNSDIRLWEILGPSDAQDYGFYARYRGDLSGVENRFELWSHNQTGADSRVYGIDQDGAVTFDGPIAANGGAISSQTNANGNYELTVEGDTYTFVK